MTTIGKCFGLAFTSWLLTSILNGVLLGSWMALQSTWVTVGFDFLLIACISAGVSIPFAFIYFLALAIISRGIDGKLLFRRAVRILFILVGLAVFLYWGFAFDPRKITTNIGIVAILLTSTYLAHILHYKRFIKIKSRNENKKVSFYS